MEEARRPFFSWGWRGEGVIEFILMLPLRIFSHNSTHSRREDFTQHDRYQSPSDLGPD